MFYLEAVFELLGHKVEDYGIDAGVDFCQVDAEVVQNEQKTEIREEWSEGCFNFTLKTNM